MATRSRNRARSGSDRRDMVLASVAIRTQAEVARLMGVTRSYVMQVEHKALEKLRKRLRKGEL